MRLDIMLPFWGKPEYLFETVDSVMTQDSDEWHLTVIDDCYPDERVPAYFASLHHPRVTYIRNEANAGIIANFRKCVELADAEYMTILGCDDRLLPQYVSTILADAKRFPGIDIIQPGVRTIGADGAPNSSLGDRIKSVLRPRTPDGPWMVSGGSACATLLTGDWLYWPSLAFNTAVLKTTPFQDYEIILDLALIIDILAAGGQLLVDPALCFEYRRHAASLSGREKLLDGSRFSDERRYFRQAARQMAQHRWTKARFAASLHATSRLYAATLLPAALRTRNTKAIKALVRHAFGS